MDQLNNSERPAEELFPTRRTMVSLVFNDTSVGRLPKPVPLTGVTLKLSAAQMAEIFPANRKMVSAVLKTAENTAPQPLLSQIKTYGESEDNGPIV